MQCEVLSFCYSTTVKQMENSKALQITPGVCKQLSKELLLDLESHPLGSHVTEFVHLEESNIIRCLY